MKLIMFSGITSDHVPVYVNPQKVRCVRPNPNGKGAQICFSRDHSVWVGECAEDVVTYINQEIQGRMVDGYEY